MYLYSTARPAARRPRCLDARLPARTIPPNTQAWLLRGALPSAELSENHNSEGREAAASDTP